MQGKPLIAKLQSSPPNKEGLMSDTLRAILVGVMLVAGSMLIGGILYVVIRDAINRNPHKD
jgi:hypothetical protein